MDSRIEFLGHTGTPIVCSKEEYQAGLRTEIQDAAGKWIDQGQDIRSIMALNEVQRLDKQFGERKANDD